MSDLIDKNASASLCGSIMAVCKARTDKLTEEPDGTVTVKAATCGPYNDNSVHVIIRAAEAAAKQLKVSQQKAIESGSAVFPFQVFGTLEVELGTNIHNKEDTPIQLAIQATLARPVHSNPAIDPLQNSAVLTGRVVTRETKFGLMTSLEFGHLSSALETGVSPAAVKLSKSTAEKLEPYMDQDVMVVGTFSRQTAKEDTDSYKKHDHISFSADSAQLIQIAAGKTRYQKSRKSAGNQTVADYESGYDSAPSASCSQEDLDDLDF